MACVVCDHCEIPLSKQDSVNILDGCSYHTRCHKCYVCSETNLKNAQVFRGVIFCSSCSQRIFQGCSAARKTKASGRTKRVRSRSRSRREKRRRQGKNREPETKGIIELARLADSADSDAKNSTEDAAKELKRQNPQLSIELPLEKQSSDRNFKNSMKKRSVEMGVTTIVTQELLQQLHCPVVMECRYDRPATSKLYKRKTDYKKDKYPSSDWRMAELGASTEIANMALREKSEQPVIIKSNLRLEQAGSYSLSLLDQDSDISSDGDKWCNSCLSSRRESFVRKLLDRHIGSILKMPYQYFKRNVLTESSLVSANKNNEEKNTSDKVFETYCTQMCPCFYNTSSKKFRLLFYEEICQHYRRELRRLYPSINRRSVPYKLGWSNISPNASRNVRCKHLSTSESYQCMRSHIMRLAGPTKSELAGFRTKVKSIVVPRFFKHMLKYENKCALKTSKACGNDVLDISTGKTHQVDTDPCNIYEIK